MGRGRVGRIPDCRVQRLENFDISISPFQQSCKLLPKYFFSYIVLHFYIGSVQSASYLWWNISNLRIFIGPRYTWGPIYGSRCLSLTPRLFAELTDVTLADEDTNSIPTDNANRAIQGNALCSLREQLGVEKFLKVIALF